jgi:glycosyltransferase involved in cell wall biosynthesis
MRGVQAKVAGVPDGPVPEPGQLRPVVYLPTWARWDEMRQRPQYLLAAFAKAGHDVYFVDPREPRERVVDGVKIVPSLSLTPRSHVILYVHFAPLRAMFDSFDDAAIVYDILDDLTIYDADEVGMPEERRVRSHHPAVVRDADVVLASAPQLVERHLPERTDILLVENGVDTDRFRPGLRVPDELAGLDRPIVGYHGAVARWFDFEIFGSAAKELPSYDFVVVGPIDDAAEMKMGELARLPNVHLVDAVPSNDIPAYVAAFDVGIIPFVVDDLTRGVSPLKMYEYLAAGVPVVATPLPVCDAHPMVRTASTPEDFAARITEAVEERADEFAADAEAAADAASWDSRVARIRQELASLNQLEVPS